MRRRSPNQLWTLRFMGVDTPRDDALIVQATIANYDVARLFMDTGRQINILFKYAFNQMQVNLVELQPMTTTLFGIIKHEVQPVGQISLPLSLREEPLKQTQGTVFIVVDVSSSYNDILGRLVMSSFQAVVTTYHQKVKFHVHDQIRKVMGDQTTMRKCYIEMVPSDLRKVPRSQHHNQGRTEVQTLQEVLVSRPMEEKETVSSSPRVIM